MRDQFGLFLFRRFEVRPPRLKAFPREIGGGKADVTMLLKPGMESHSYEPSPRDIQSIQNCDLFFDKVFADDRAHVEGFRYFDRFKSFAEVPDVLAGKCPGRTSDTERILAYNIGIALHDVYFASRIYDMVLARQLGAECSLHEPTDKFWI